jgi:hypothetical protein
MKRFFAMTFLAVLTAFSLFACSSTTVGGTTLTRNDQLYASAEAITAIDNSVTQLVSTGAITKVQAQQVSDQSKALRAALGAEASAPASAPGGSLAQIAAAIASLQAYVATLGSH